MRKHVQAKVQKKPPEGGPNSGFPICKTAAYPEPDTEHSTSSAAKLKPVETCVGEKSHLGVVVFTNLQRYYSFLPRC